MRNDKHQKEPMKGEKYHAIIDMKLNKYDMGYFIRAKPNENWEEMKLKLKQNEKNVVEFIAKNSENKIFLRYDDDQQEKVLYF